MPPDRPDPDLATLLSLFTYRELARGIARQLDRDQALAFLYEFDEAMADWDFTLEACKQMTGSLRSFWDEIGANPDMTAVANVAEAVRQMRMGTDTGGVVAGVWRDPHADPVNLTLDDLERIVDLASACVTRTPKENR